MLILEPPSLLAPSALGARGEKSKQSATYAWLCKNAATYGFYPYLAEGWHWEYNPPGNVEKVQKYRENLIANAGVLNIPNEVKQSDSVPEAPDRQRRVHAAA